MEYLSVFLKEQIIALTKAYHSKGDIEQLLGRFSKQLMNLAVLSMWNNISLDCVQSSYGSIPMRIKLCVRKKRQTN